MNQRRKLFLIALQVVLWAAFLSLPYFMMPHPPEDSGLNAFARHYFPNPDTAENIFLSSLALNICLIIFFYAHQYLIFDRLVIQKKFAAYFILLGVVFLAIFFISYTFRHMLFHPVHPRHASAVVNARDIIRVGTWYLLVLLISLGLKLLSQWRQAEERTKEIENERLRTELSFLYAQINPHFLFNSLNAVYSLALKKSDAAPGAIIKLSQLMRYVVDEAGKTSAPLSMEINYVNNYLELQKLRSASDIKVNFNISGPAEAVSIAPLVLLPFVENAFKYGIAHAGESIIDMSLEVEGKVIRFKIRNRNYGYQSFEGEKNSAGIGMSNVKRRLDLLYPHSHTLLIEDSDDYYSVQLNLQST